MLQGLLKDAFRMFLSEQIGLLGFIELLVVGYFSYSDYMSGGKEKREKYKMAIIAGLKPALTVAVILFFVCFWATTNARLLAKTEEVSKTRKEMAKKDRVNGKKNKLIKELKKSLRSKIQKPTTGDTVTSHNQSGGITALEVTIGPKPFTLTPPQSKEISDVMSAYRGHSILVGYNYSRDAAKFAEKISLALSRAGMVVSSHSFTVPTGGRPEFEMFYQEGDNHQFKMGQTLGEILHKIRGPEEEIYLHPSKGSKILTIEIIR